MRVSVSTLVSVAAIAALGSAWEPVTAAQAGDAVLQVFASPLVIDQANFVSNVAGVSPVETIELHSIAALQRLCAAANDGIPSVAVVGTKITANISEECVSNGVGDLLEASLGFSTLVLVQKASDPAMSLSSKVLYQALAHDLPDDESFKPNTAKTWSDVESGLPNLDIRLFVGPPGGAARKVFEDEAMVGGCRQFSVVQSIFEAKTRVSTCTKFKEGAVLEVDSLDERVAALRAAAPGAVAVLPINIALKHKDWLRIVPFDGFLPTPESVNAEDYVLTVPVYMYVRPEDLAEQGTARLWVEEMLSEEAIGDAGYGKDHGLIELPAATREWQRRSMFK
jgi:phosphate transport system substrate-binding protein